MKTALCITGIYRPWVQIPAKTLVENMTSVLTPTDVYFHTWTESKDIAPYDCIHCPEPVLDYHPVDDVTVDCKHGKFVQYKRDKTLHTKTAHRNKQLLGYADIVDKLPKKYDLLIRARWETIVSTRFNYDKYKQKALEDGPIGFMIRPNRGQSIDNDLSVSTDPFDDWFQFLPDALIFHQPHQYSTELVWDLHKQKNLLPAEWGWYQILSKPYGDIHTSVHGGAHIAR